MKNIIIFQPDNAFQLSKKISTIPITAIPSAILVISVLEPISNIIANPQYMLIWQITILNNLIYQTQKEIYSFIETLRQI